MDDVRQDVYNLIHKTGSSTEEKPVEKPEIKPEEKPSEITCTKKRKARKARKPEKREINIVTCPKEKR